MRESKYNLLYRWIRFAQSGITLKHLLLNRKLQKTALYGYDRVAECILYELRDSHI